MYGKVISVVFMSLDFTTKSFYICQHSTNPKECILYKVTFLDDLGYNKCGVWYAPIELSLANENNTISQKDINHFSLIYGILCPCVSRSFHLKSSYAVICNNWKYRDKHNVLSLPEVSVNLFHSSIFK